MTLSLSMVTVRTVYCPMLSGPAPTCLTLRTYSLTLSFFSVDSNISFCVVARGRGNCPPKF